MIHYVADYGLGVRWLWVGPIGFRFGRHPRPLFSERYQGTRGIPRRFFYLFGGRLTIIKRRRRAEGGVITSTKPLTVVLPAGEWVRPLSASNDQESAH